MHQIHLTNLNVSNVLLRGLDALGDNDHDGYTSDISPPHFSCPLCQCSACSLIRVGTPTKAYHPSFEGILPATPKTQEGRRPSSLVKTASLPLFPSGTV
jgi:hypothetical protein